VLGRSGSLEHEAARRTRNEFMAASSWDGSRSKDKLEIRESSSLVPQKRPFDLDFSVIRHLSKRQDCFFLLGVSGGFRHQPLSSLPVSSCHCQESYPIAN